jgi:hypothetical protein
MFVRKAGAYPSGVPKGSSLYRQALGLIHIHKHSTGPERLARDKHSSLLRTFMNYGLTLGPRITKIKFKKAISKETCPSINCRHSCYECFGKMSVGQILLGQKAGHQNRMLLTFPFRPFRRRRRPVVEKRTRPGSIVTAPHYLCNLSILQKSPCFEPGACIIKLITAIIYGFRNKLECLSLASISSLDQCLGTNTIAFYGKRRLRQ